jgi:hypothetical protein
MIKFRNWVYYEMKPAIPALLRHTARRWVVQKKRPRVRHVWPILPGSQMPPSGWPGWPNGKRFAVVLTHDVEGPSGLAKCRCLMNCEMELSFRSSFNLIPEGPYAVPKDLRDELIANGFEVGVHDLRHDGKLYRTRREFLNNAERINGYLREWSAVGFRSGFMLHNLEWAHQLDVLYEASTFDTDPFEPQPDGLGTIFPRWITRAISGNGESELSQYPTRQHRKAGYLELPYTLAQDSTLFLFLRERNPDIWIQKLDWIASHGGMVLMDTHPDYMAFQEPHNGNWEYPVEHYIKLLKYVASRYAGEFWQALPREVAAYWQQVMPEPEINWHQKLSMNRI